MWPCRAIRHPQVWLSPLWLKRLSITTPWCVPSLRSQVRLHGGWMDDGWCWRFPSSPLNLQLRFSANASAAKTHPPLWPDPIAGPCLPTNRCCDTTCRLQSHPTHNQLKSLWEAEEGKHWDSSEQLPPTCHMIWWYLMIVYDSYETLCNVHFLASYVSWVQVFATCGRMQVTRWCSDALRIYTRMPTALKPS